MISNNYQKRIGKKLRRHQQIVSKEVGVTTVSTPTKNLAICNAGQINGLTEEVLVENYGKYGAIDRVMLIPGKSCSFLSFRELRSATEALECTNGLLNIGQDGKPVYLSYVESLPIVEDGKIYETLPPGLILLENFIDEQEESDLTNMCHFKDDESGSVMKHRQVIHFGYEFRYDINNVDKDKPLPDKIPDKCNFLFKRLAGQGVLSKNFEPDQLTVNHYRPGQGIPSHIDTHSAFEDPLLSLSLGSDVIMEFKRQSETICVLLPRRSLLIMSGESRYDWTHGITPKKYDFYYTQNECKSFKRGTRVSFTFRKVLKGHCSCDYKSNCDSQQTESKIDQTSASKLENLHVHEVYEDIASHFSDTRHKPWPNVLDFVMGFSVGDVLVDVGCGNGKYFGHNKSLYEIGIDHSFKLNEFCSGRGFQTLTGNCLDLPLRDNVADGVMSIAVIHHLATEERRLKAIQEITRILRKGGTALIYVWAKEQVKNSEKSTYIKQDRKNRKADPTAVGGAKEEVLMNITENVTLPVHVNRTDFAHSDLLVPWKLKNTNAQNETATFLRFYHVFENGELDELCRKIPEVEIIKSYYDQGNCCVVFKKIADRGCNT